MSTLVRSGLESMCAMEKLYFLGTGQECAIVLIYLAESMSLSLESEKAFFFLNDYWYL
jgi:hypothetical protein